MTVRKGCRVRTGKGKVYTENQEIPAGELTEKEVEILKKSKILIVPTTSKTVKSEPVKGDNLES